MTEQEARAILCRPYERVLVPDDDGTFFARIREFRGCYATGETAAEAAAALEDVAASWLIGCAEAGLAVPDVEGGER